MKRKGFRADSVYEVTAADGAAIGTINETRSSLTVGERAFTMKRKGVFTPEYELKSGEEIIAVAKQKALVNTFKVAHAGKEWTFKAVSLLAEKFGLFDGENQTGTVASGSFLKKFTDITVELPDTLPLEMQLFLIYLAIHVWSQPSS
jgi:hypothetical protein